MMGGPGSGRFGGRRVAGRFAAEADPRNLPYPPEPGLSRVCLEPVMARAAVVADAGLVDAIGTELAARAWQNLNPYAAWLPGTSPGAPGPV